MANLIGKIRTRTHDWLEGREKTAQEHHHQGIQKKEANRVASSGKQGASGPDKTALVAVKEVCHGK